MILNSDYLINKGFKVSVDEEIIDKAIFDAEIFYVKSVIGDANYIRLSTGPVPVGTDDDIALNGGVKDNKFYAGLKQAIANITYAFLLRDNVNAVRFGTVRKYDDNSSNVDETLLYNTSKHYFTIGKAYLKEVFDLLDGCSFNNANGCQFDEFNNLF